MIARLKELFFGLQQRERWIVAVGAAAAVVIIVWGFVVSPMRAEAARLRTSVDTKQRLLVDVQRLEAEQPSPGGGNGRKGADQTLVVIIDDTARSHGLGSPRTTQNGPSGINVTIQSASFDSLVQWLIVLHGTYGIDVETGQLAKAREPGLVNGQLLLRR
jgi:type II secretory pathway component PulM